MSIKKHYRAVWLSDIHLGHKACKAQWLVNFLEQSTIDTLYLVGDIVDIWSLRKKFYWPQSHNTLFKALLALSNSDTRVIYLPGNHDELIQPYDGMNLGDIEVYSQFIHTTAQGKQLLLAHGDQFDEEVFNPVERWVGDKGYELLLFLNHWCNAIRTRFNRPYWSLAGFIKARIKRATVAINTYRHAAISQARCLNVDGVICGHIHFPEITEVDEITYYNTGDWIENSSLLIEDHQGCVDLFHWCEQNGLQRACEKAAPTAQQGLPVRDTCSEAA